MALDADGEWDGICACGKKESDGVHCRLGATHKPYKPPPMPWELPQEKPKEEFPW